jgi:chromosome segregation ATPase
MSDSTETLVSINGHENEILEQRIKKVTKELQSHFINEGGRGASTDSASTDKPLPSHKIYDESALQYFEAISKLTEEQGEQLSILTEQARRLVAENEELRRKSDAFGRSRHEKRNENAYFGTRSEAMHTFIKDKDQNLPQDPSLLSEENACLTEHLVLINKELDHQNNLLQSRDQTINTLNVKLSKLTGNHNKLQSQIQQLYQDKSFCEDQLVQNISDAQRNEATLQKLEIELDGMRTRYNELEERSKDMICEREELQSEAEQLSTKASFCIKHS